MQFEPNWSESFILKWFIHQKKGETYIRWICEQILIHKSKKQNQRPLAQLLTIYLGNFNSDARTISNMLPCLGQWFTSIR